MTSVTESQALDQGMHKYHLRNYDEAIAILSSRLSEPNLSTRDIAIINLWLGKCYYEKPESHVQASMRYTPSVMRRGAKSSPLEEPIEYQETAARMAKTALSYFNNAVNNDDSLAEAHYWKGKSHEYRGEIDNAFASFVRAATLSQSAADPRAENRKYVEKCVEFYSLNQNLLFLPFRDLNSILEDQAIQNLRSNEPYTRMESCLSLMERLKGNLDFNQSERIKSNLSAAAGCKLLCCYLPYTGDADNRVKMLARSIIFRIENAVPF